VKNRSCLFVVLPLLLNGLIQAQSDKTVRIIPEPLSVTVGSGTFAFTAGTHLSVCAEASDAAEALIRRFWTVAGFRLGEHSGSDASAIEFVPAAAADSLGEEGYLLNVTSTKVNIRASHSAGFFYAVQTLLQCLPPEIAGAWRSDRIAWQISAVTIRDVPKYPWRSFMLDSGRQYQSVEFIKRYLDFLSQLKINVFHWHLTEGQGWRIEIRKYPKLTEIGSRVAAGEEQQGYYSQPEIKEIVEYARRRCITVVPEIDLPGHSEAALRAYPELTCRKLAPPLVTEFSSHLFCGGSEDTYTFIENVLAEVCDLFPGEYVHMGGDEAPKDIWDSCEVCRSKIRQEGLKNSHELQIYFSSRVAAMLQRHGKKCILWGDVVEQSGPRMPDNVVIYWWNYRKKVDTAYMAAIKMGYPVICGTNYYTYLNFPVTPWARYLEDRTFDMRQMYTSNPSDMARPAKGVLGVGACLWTDWNVTMRMIDQRVFPRLLVLAQQMWSKGQRLPFEEFYNSIKHFYPRLEAMDIQYGPALKEEVPHGYQWE
jgi:hexosaminidase